MCVAVVALARCGHPLRFYITPHCPQCQPVSRKLLLWSTPLRALRVKATGVMQNCLRWVRLSWRCGIGQALRAVFLVSGLRPVMLCVPRPPCGLAAARHWPCAGLPVRPQGAQLSSAQRGGKGSPAGLRPAIELHAHESQLHPYKCHAETLTSVSRRFVLIVCPRLATQANFDNKKGLMISRKSLIFNH